LQRRRYFRDQEIISLKSEVILRTYASRTNQLPRLAMVALLSVVLIFHGPITTARADIFGDFAGLVTDPLKLGRLSDRLQQTVMDALAQVQQLLGRANDIAEQRLNQVKDIVEFAIQGGEAVEAKAFADLQKLESQIMADLNRVIFRARCAAVVTLNGSLQNAIAQALETLAASQPSLTIIGLPIGRLHLKNVTIPEPDKAYFQAYHGRLKTLDSLVNDNTNAYEMLSTYAFPYPAKAGCATVAGSRRTRLAPPGKMPVFS
jgi:hypothetical protein